MMFLDDTAGFSTPVDSMERLLELLVRGNRQYRSLGLMSGSRFRQQVLDWALQHPEQVPYDLEIEFFQPTRAEAASLHRIDQAKRMPYSYGKLMR